MNKTLQNKILDLNKYFERLKAYRHAIDLLNYDGQTVAPKNTYDNKIHSLSILNEDYYKIKTDPKIEKLISYLNNYKDELDEVTQRELYLLTKDTEDLRKIPLDEYLKYQEILGNAEIVWKEAKDKNDFKLFEPYLEEIFKTTEKFATYLNPNMKPYDYWLNEYEEGLNTSIADEFFNKLKERIVPLIKKVNLNKDKVNDDCLKGNFPIYKQEKLSLYLMELMKEDMTRLGLSTTIHPFTSSLGCSLDERITTHYYEDNFVSSMYSVIHEGGHALYDMGSNKEFKYTNLDGGVSMGIHESQSRFYENIIGRSKEFITYIYPKIIEIFPTLSNSTPEEFYKAINKVEPSLIRTEADEVTYSLHVFIRYEIEKGYFEGKYKVKDFPTIWNKLYKEYLGVDVPNDSMGVLQDSHWSGGAIGYFPSYALGSAYGAQFLSLMKKDFDIYKEIEKGDFTKINEWNQTHIWQYGSLYSPKKLLNKIFKEEGFNPNYYLDYLENKVKEVYGL